MPKHDPAECTLKTCNRKKPNHYDLLCPSHWRMVPAPMKRKLWAAMKVRSKYEQGFQTMVSAGEILDWLEKNATVLLAPDVKLATPEPEIESTPKIITSLR